MSLVLEHVLGKVYFIPDTGTLLLSWFDRK
jgi:hypothetical protein